jgi:hypothetical protein
MSENVPTFGRENLPREAEKAEWDRLEQWHNSITERDNWAIEDLTAQERSDFQAALDDLRSEEPPAT